MKTFWKDPELARNNETPIRVGLLGAGTVGSQTARLIVEQKDELSARIGRPVELTGVACLDPEGNWRSSRGSTSPSSPPIL